MKKLSAFVLTSAPVVAFAHPDHTPAESLMHAFETVGLVGLAGLIAFGVYKYVKK